MYPTSLIHCYKYLLFTWRNDIKMLHSTGFSSLIACPLLFQGTLRSFVFIYNAVKEVTRPPPSPPTHTHTLGKLCFYIQCHVAGNRPSHTPLFLLPFTPIYDLYTLLLSLPTIQPLICTAPIHMSILCPKPLSMCFVFCCIY